MKIPNVRSESERLPDGRLRIRFYVTDEPMTPEEKAAFLKVLEIVTLEAKFDAS